jgi:hypothetical protein
VGVAVGGAGVLVGPGVGVGPGGSGVAVTMMTTTVWTPCVPAGITSPWAEPGTIICGVAGAAGTAAAAGGSGTRVRSGVGVAMANPPSAGVHVGRGVRVGVTVAAGRLRRIWPASREHETMIAARITSTPARTPAFRLRMLMILPSSRQIRARRSIPQGREQGQATATTRRTIELAGVRIPYKQKT